MISFTVTLAKSSFNNKDDYKRNFIQFQNKSIVEEAIVNTENSRKWFLQEIDFEVGDSVLLTSWMTELPNKRIRSFKKEKSMKGTKEERQEIHIIQAEIIKRII